MFLIIDNNFKKQASFLANTNKITQYLKMILYKFVNRHSFLSYFVSLSTEFTLY